MAPNNYSQHLDTLFGGGIDPWDYLMNSALIYETVVGSNTLWFIVLAAPFLSLWIKQQSVTIPVVVYCSIGGVMAIVAPPELSAITYNMLMIGIVGLIYQVVKNRN